MLNLLTDSCFPVVHRDGTHATLAFADLTRDYQTNPVVDFALPRADLQASAYQLGIAWLQTVFSPDSEENWQDLLESPPSAEELSQQFAAYAPAFLLWQETGPCFMQDLEDLEGDERSVHTLFIEAPGGNTLKNNADHFIKRDQVTKLSPFTTALALFCLQTHAPSGGKGHRTGIRGGGPLTTIPKGRTLWASLWLSVLPHKHFLKTEAYPGKWPQRPEPEAIFPWLQPTLTSETKHACVHHGQVHPLQIYWAMPRRIRLQAPTAGSTRCDLTQIETPLYFQTYITKSYGNNYEGMWQHPLTPHYLDKQGQKLPRHGQPGSFAYQHWLGLVLSEYKKGGGNEPAEVVGHFLSERHRFLRLDLPQEATSQFWAFGYDMDNMKARSWIEAEMPLPLPHNNLADFKLQVEGLIQAAKHVAVTTRKAYLKATVGRSGKTRGDVTFVDARFWEKTQASFYTRLAELSADPMQKDSSELWLQDLSLAALELFDALTEIRPVDCDPIDPRAWAEARIDLKNFTGPNGKNMRGRVSLPPLSKDQGDIA